MSDGCPGFLRRSRIGVNGAVDRLDDRVLCERTLVVRPDHHLSSCAGIGEGPDSARWLGWRSGFRAVADWGSSPGIGWRSGIGPPPPEQSRPRRPRVAADGVSGGTTVLHGRRPRIVALRSRGCFFPFCDNYFCGACGAIGNLLMIVP